MNRTSMSSIIDSKSSVNAAAHLMDFLEQLGLKSVVRLHWGNCLDYSARLGKYSI